MIIDCHTHIGRNQHINFSVDELLRSMDRAGVDKSLVFAGELNDCSNEYLVEQIRPHKDRLYGVAAYTKGSKILPFKQFISDNNLVAIKFYTGYDHYYPIDLFHQPDDPLSICRDLSIPAIFHCGDCLNSATKAKLKYSHPLNIDDVAVNYDDVKFIIAHMGFPWHRDAAEVCYKNSNVYSDISGFVYDKFSEKTIQKFKKVLDEFLDIDENYNDLLFGSDVPVSDQKSYVEVVGSMFDLHQMSKNAMSVFNLKE